MMIGSDSAPIVRVDLTTHAFDTAAMVRVLKLKAKVYPRENGGSYAMIESNPVPMIDEWAVLSDGSVALVRGQDYHIDFINPDGSMTRGPKMAYAWEPLSDDAKIALVDSLKKKDEESRKQPSAPISMSGGSGTSGTAGGSGRAGGGGSGAGVAGVGSAALLVGAIVLVRAPEPLLPPPLHPEIAATRAAAPPRRDIFMRTKGLRPVSR